MLEIHADYNFYEEPLTYLSNFHRFSPRLVFWPNDKLIAENTHYSHSRISRLAVMLKCYPCSNQSKALRPIMFICCPHKKRKANTKFKFLRCNGSGVQVFVQRVLFNHKHRNIHNQVLPKRF